MILARAVTHRNIVRTLLIGFALVIVALVLAALVSFEYMQSIRGSASALVSEQLSTTRLINEIQREQGALGVVMHRLAGDPEDVDRERTMTELDAADQAIRRTIAAAAGTPEEPLWQELETAVADFAAKARRCLDAKSGEPDLMRDLVKAHGAVVAVTARLIAAGYARSSQAERAIGKESRQLVQQSIGLLGASLLLALLCAVLTIRTTSELLRKMEWQSGELSRVSWQLLERQEDTARRFSHELHDELGQALAAIKANLFALNPADPAAKARTEDCLHVVDEAISTVREMSQLLRPIILDDFGLDPALRWLAERFTTRTGIQVEYRGGISCRLADETETHLFRIAQEALTNVARHSEATRVTMELSRSNGTLHLRIADNGKGLTATDSLKSGLGMVGMRARARSAGGEVTVSSHPGQGVSIDAAVPATNVPDEAQDPSFVGR